jgi:polar amino acid transport system substrate-binding protein
MTEVTIINVAVPRAIPIKENQVTIYANPASSLDFKYLAATNLSTIIYKILDENAMQCYNSNIHVSNQKILMKRILSVLLIILLSGCRKEETIKLGTSADAPPFEYVENGVLKGFDIDFAKLIGKKLNIKIQFEDMPFGSLIVAIQTGQIDGIISSLNISAEKKKILDFTDEYFCSKMALLFKKENAVTNLKEVNNKKIICQLGTNGHEKKIMEKAPNAEIQFVDTLPQGVEALKADHVNFVFMDESAAKNFCVKNKDLQYIVVAEYDIGGYAIALKKGSPLVARMNKAIRELKKEGVIDDLKKRYIGE